VKLADGSRVRLRAVRVGASVWVTCDVWVAEFVTALTADALPADTPMRSASQRTRTSERAGAELKAGGW
jgi:hypothetical protein